jgi:hypothetical protein
MLFYNKRIIILYMKKTAVTKTVTKNVGKGKVTTTITTTTTTTTTKKTVASPSQPKAETKPMANWGNLKEVSGFVFLENEVPITEGTSSLGYQQLPKGYSLPTVKDYSDLLAALGPNAYDALLDPKGFAGKEGMNYMTNEKSYPGLTNGGDNKAWQFKALVLKNKSATIEDVASFFSKGAMLGKVVPMKEGYDFNSPVSGSITAPITVSVSDPKGVISVEWVFGDGGKATGLNASYQYKKCGEFEIEATIHFFGNIILKGKKKILVLETAAVGEDEIIDGVNYGKPVIIGKQIWLNKDVANAVNNEGKVVSLDQGKGPGPKGENDFGLSLVCAPPGWRLPTQKDFNQLIEAAGKTDQDRITFLLNKEGFNGKEEHYYIATDFLDENSPASLFIGKTKPSIEKRWKWANAYCSFFATRLIANEKYTLIANFTQNNVHVNEPFQFKFLNSNITNIEWEFEAGKTSKDKEPTYKYSTPGFKTVKVAVTLFGNRKITDEFEILLVGSDKDRKIEPSKIVVTKIADSVYNQSQVTICHSTASITPKNGGGYYACYRDNSSKKLIVKSFDESGKETGKEVALEDAFVIYVCAIPKGCIVLASTENQKLFITGIADNGSIIFTRNIINNGKDPVKVTEQVHFCDKEGNPHFGSNMMFNPDNGKVIYANKRVMTLFSHYNCFKLSPRDCHTGDCMLSFDLSGKDERCAWMWGVSHSVLNTMMYDGVKVMSASLGDAYPVNITIANNETVTTNGEIDGKAKKENMLCSKKLGSAVAGFIPGNHAGCTAGRIGSIVQIGNLYYLPYSRAPAKFIEGEGNTVDELAIIVYKQNLQILRTMKLGKGANIMTLKSCVYGKNILLLFAEEPSSKNVIGWPPHLNLANSKVVMMLVSTDGKILQREELKGVGMTSSDDIRVMGDGSIAWTWVDSSALKICKMP